MYRLTLIYDEISNIPFFPQLNLFRTKLQNIEIYCHCQYQFFDLSLYCLISCISDHYIEPEELNNPVNKKKLHKIVKFKFIAFNRIKFGINLS